MYDIHIHTFSSILHSLLLSSATYYGYGLTKTRLCAVTKRVSKEKTIKSQLSMRSSHPLRIVYHKAREKRQ